MNEEIIELYEQGKTIPEIIVELNTTYKHVKKAIDAYEESKENE